MTRDCVVIPLKVEDLGVKLESGVRRKRHRSRGGNQKNKSRSFPRYQATGVLWRKLFSPEPSSGESDELLLDIDRDLLSERLHFSRYVDSDSDDISEVYVGSDREVEADFVDNRRRRRNNRRNERRRHRREPKEKHVRFVDSSSEEEEEEERLQVQDEETQADFSSNLNSLRSTDAVVRNDKFEYTLPLKDVVPENITVVLQDQVLTISAKKEEVSEDGMSKLYQEFTKKIILPENVVEKELKSSLSSNGVLKIEAPLAKPIPVEPEVKEIPIEVEIVGNVS